MYDPRLGRFLTPDPIIAAPHFSQSWNPYSYVLNNPLAYVDPSGFQQEPPTEERFEIRNAGSGEPDITYFGPPILVQDSPGEAEDPRESAAQAGDIVTPTDVGVTGTTAGLIPQPTLSDAAQRTIHILGEVELGAHYALEEMALHAAKAVVLNVLTFGGYGTYETGTAIWAGYLKDGVLGAVNKVNPFYHIGEGSRDATLAAMQGDYRAAGAAGMTTAVLMVTTVVGAAGGAAALTEAAAARAAAGGVVRGAPSLPAYVGGKTSGVFRTPAGDTPLISGYKGPSASMPRGTPGMNGRIKSHVEAHAAAVMREQGLKDATLYINRAPCAGATGCGAMLPRMLPEGGRLRVVGPNGYDQVFVGSPD
jgi:hypothetical protein